MVKNHSKYFLIVFALVVFTSQNTLAISDGETYCPRLEGVKTPCVLLEPGEPPPPPEGECNNNSDCDIVCYSGGTPTTVPVANRSQGACNHQNCQLTGEGTTQCACDSWDPPTCDQGQVTCMLGASPTTVPGTCTSGSCSNPGCPSGSSTNAQSCPTSSTCP